MACLCLGLIAVLVGLGMATSAAADAAAQTPPKPVLVLAAFGTSDAEARQVYAYIDQAARRRYPGYDIRWGFTAQFIVNKLREHGDATVTGMADLTVQLRYEGVKQVAVQSLLIWPGAENADLYYDDYGPDMRVTFGAPLIASATDVAAVSRLLATAVTPGEPNVGIVHGNSKDPEFNRTIAAFCKQWQAECPMVTVASVEGQPGTAPLLKVRAQLRAASASPTTGGPGTAGRVNFIPVMLVAGDHVKNDVLAEHDSWKAFIGATAVTCAPPLGYNDAILELYFQHLDQALAELAHGGGTAVERAARTAALDAAKAERVAPEGEKSRYSQWKRDLSFWPRKLWGLLELMAVLTLGVLVGQALEVSGLIRYVAVLCWPILRLGRLPKVTGAAFLMSFQSGAVANSMLVSYRDQGLLSRAELYTSVLVVSGLSLFSHLPMFVIPLGALLGWQATAVFFGVRMTAILLQVTIVLTLGRWLLARFVATAPAPVTEAPPAAISEAGHGAAAAPANGKARPAAGFWRQVWRNSARTLKRLLYYVVPTFAIMAVLEHVLFFEWLANQMPGLFRIGFLPPEAALVIPAQAANLYNGAIAAANFVDAGAISVKQAVVILLAGSVLTAPVRTFRHALPTYIATLGLRPGTALAVTAQVLRCTLVLTCTLILIWLW